MEFDVSKHINSQSLYDNIKDIDAIEEDPGTFQDSLHTLFLYFRSVALRSIFIPTIMRVLSFTQLVCSISILPIILNFYWNQDNFICIIIRTVIELFPSREIDTDNYQAITIIQIISSFCVFMFWYAIYKIRARIPFKTKLSYILYFYSFELPTILIIPNTILAGRAIFLSFNRFNYRYITFTVVQILITFLISYQIYCISIFSTSLLASNMNVYYITNRTPHYQIYILAFVSFTLCNYTSTVNGIAMVSTLYAIISLIYFEKTRKILYVNKFEISTHYAFAISFLFIAGTGFVSIFHRFQNRLGLYTYLSFITFFIAFLIAYLLVSLKVKRLTKKISSISTISDFNIKSGMDLLQFAYISYYNSNKFIFDGSIFKFALECNLEPQFYVNILRLLSCLPLSLPYIHELEKKAQISNDHTRFDEFKIFEYFTIKKFRTRENLNEDKEYYAKMSRAIFKFFEIISGCVPVIQHEKTQKLFLYGSFLSLIERKLESYVERMLLRYPTKQNFLKLGILFYEKCAFNQADANKLSCILNYTNNHEFPDWREMITQSLYLKIDSKVETESEDQTSTESIDLTAGNQTLKSAFSNDNMKIDPKQYFIAFAMGIFYEITIIVFILLVIIGIGYQQKVSHGTLNIMSQLNHETSNFCKLIIYAFLPCENHTDSIEIRRNIVRKILLEFENTHTNFRKSLINTLTNMEVLNNSVAWVFKGRFMPSRTISGESLNFSFITMGSRFATFIERLLLADTCHQSNYYNISQEFYLNITNWFLQFDNAFTSSLALSIHTTEKRTIVASNLGCVIVSLATLASLISIFYIRWKLHKIQSSLSDGVPTKETGIITSIVSSIAHSSHYYILWCLVLLTVVMILLTISQYTYYSNIKIVSQNILSMNTDIARELKQSFLFGSGIAAVRLQLINPSLKVEVKKNVETAMRFISLTNRKTSFNYSAIFQISKLLGLSYFENSTELMEEYAVNSTAMFIKDLIPSNELIISERNETVSIKNLEQSFFSLSIYSMLFILTNIVILVMTRALYIYVHSVLYTEMLTKLIPYIRTAVSEDGSNSVMGLNENSFSLDLVGYPAAIIDEDCKIVFVNHLWLTAFNGVMSTFIDIDYRTLQLENAHVVPHVVDGLNIVVMEKSKEMSRLTTMIDAKKKEYKKVIKVLHPLESFTDEMKKRQAIVLSLVFLPFVEGDMNEEVDACHFQTRLIIDTLKDFVKGFGARFLTWSFGEIQIVFGLTEYNEQQAALQALTTAYFAIQMAIEGENFFNLTIAAVIMSGNFTEMKFDGREARQNRYPNAIILTKKVSDLVVEYVCDMAYIYNGFITLNVDDREIEVEEEEESDDIMYI